MQLQSGPTGAESSRNESRGRCRSAAPFSRSLRRDKADGLLADWLEVDRLTSPPAFIHEPLRGFPYVGIERPSEALVSGNHNYKYVLLLAFDEKRMQDLPSLLVVEIRAADHGDEHAGEHAGIWASPHRPVLRTAQLGCGDHLHGFGNLPRVLHAADSSP